VLTSVSLKKIETFLRQGLLGSLVPQISPPVIRKLPTEVWYLIRVSGDIKGLVSVESVSKSSLLCSHTASLKAASLAYRMDEVCNFLLRMLATATDAPPSVDLELVGTKRAATRKAVVMRNSIFVVNVDVDIVQ
jgi:hypothetical protein